MFACPHCRAEHKSDPRNGPGAVTLCLVGGGWIVHVGPGAVRGPGPREAATIAEKPDFQRIRQAWERMQLKLGMVAEGRIL